MTTVYVVLTPWGEVESWRGPAVSWTRKDAIRKMRELATNDYEVDMLQGADLWGYMPARECWEHGYSVRKASIEVRP